MWKAGCSGRVETTDSVSDLSDMSAAAHLDKNWGGWVLVKTYLDLIRSYSDYSSRYLRDVFGGVRVDVVDKNTFWTTVLLFVSHGVRFSQTVWQKQLWTPRCYGLTTVATSQGASFVRKLWLRPNCLVAPSFPSLESFPCVCEGQSKWWNLLHLPEATSQIHLPFHGQRVPQYLFICLSGFKRQKQHVKMWRPENPFSSGLDPLLKGQHHVLQLI